MNIKNRILLCITLLAASGTIVAEPITASKQKPKAIHIAPHAGMFVFFANVTDGQKPECSGDNRWSIKTTRPGADALISMVIAAKLSGGTISIKGTGNCNPDGWGYEISYMYLD